MSDQLLCLQKKENNSQEICERSCRKRKREILSKHGSFALANLEVIITRISHKKTDGTIGFCNKCFILNKEFLARENAA
jgi:hypothetical protein